MRYAHLGRFGAKVSRLCLGTMNFGPQTSEADSHAIMDRALDAGINFVDTANVYGWRTGEGWTEQIVGRWLARDEGRRDKVFLATKVYGGMSKDTWPNFDKLSALNIVRAVEGSLRRLQTDRIDLYQMHHVDREAPWDEIWQAMETLVRQGKVLYVGSSNFAGWHIAAANEAAYRRHFLGLVSEQCVYNLAQRTVELEVLPAVRAYGMGAIPYSPLAGGLLGGTQRGSSKGRRSTQRQKDRIKEHAERLERYEKLCADLGQDPANVALAWVLANPAVASVITGPRTTEQLEAALSVPDLTLEPSTMKSLDAIWPGPGGPAPEAFAW